MSFFRNIWKNASRHKKLSEDWNLATSLTDFTKNIDTIEEFESNLFNVKYLGNTIIGEAHSEEKTANAVKQVIQKTKSNLKNLQRVSLYISPKGIEMCDMVTGETLMQISIYKISYCSADAAHNRVFAFISSGNKNSQLDINGLPSGTETDSSSSQTSIDNTDLDEHLVLHAFQCDKRKVAQNLTLTVAKHFEMAFQLWQKDKTKKNSNKLNKKKINNHNDNNNLIINNKDKNNSKSDTDDSSVRNILIDINSEITSTMCSKDQNYFQNTWVSFEDEHRHDEKNLEIL